MSFQLLLLMMMKDLENLMLSSVIGYLAETLTFQGFGL